MQATLVKTWCIICFTRAMTITLVLNIWLSHCCFLAISIIPAGPFCRHDSAFLTIFCRRTCRGRGASMAAQESAFEFIGRYRKLLRSTMAYCGPVYPRAACKVQPRIRNISIAGPFPQPLSIFMIHFDPLLYNWELLLILSRKSLTWEGNKTLQYCFEHQALTF